MGGVEYRHLCYHFVLPYSNWEWVELARGETFEALAGGLQESLWVLGGVPLEHRTDNLSAATHQLRQTGGREFNERYLEFLGHFGLRASRNHPGRANENGDVESSHGHFKRALDQRLRLRGSRDFRNVEQYRGLLADLAGARNRRRQERLEEEREVLRPLPGRRLPVYRERVRTVTRGSVVRVANKAYSVPSRLIGERVVVRLHADRVELLWDGQVVAGHERARGARRGRVNYRHVVHSLVRKPGAFARYRYREEMFPTRVFRAAYDRLREGNARRADLEYVRVLHLAATEMESQVERALEECLPAGRRPTLENVRAALGQPQRKVPQVRLQPPDLKAYDELLRGGRLR